MITKGLQYKGLRFCLVWNFFFPFFTSVADALMPDFEQSLLASPGYSGRHFAISFFSAWQHHCFKKYEGAHSSSSADGAWKLCACVQTLLPQFYLV